MVLLDGLYPNGPVMEICRKNNWDFMIVLQDDSLPSVWEEIKQLQPLQKENRLRQTWGNRTQMFRWVSDIDYRHVCPTTKKEKQQLVHAVICAESWEVIAPDSTEVATKTSRHVWISSEPLHKRAGHERCNLGARGLIASIRTQST